MEPAANYDNFQESKKMTRRHTTMILLQSNTSNTQSMPMVSGQNVTAEIPISKTPWTNMESFSCIWKLIFISFMYLIFYDNNEESFEGGQTLELSVHCISGK